MSDARDTIETPILIVGGGSVGLALASDLGTRGVSCFVVEQNERPADHPRATAINARSMEFMRRWGVAKAVRNASAPEDFPAPPRAGAARWPCGLARRCAAG